MKVLVDVHGSVREPYMRVQDEHVLAMMLRHGAIEVGARRSTMQHVTFQAGEIGFLPRHSEPWVGSGNQERLLVGISDAALRTAREGLGGTVELGHWCKMVDARLAALVKAVNAERIAGFPSGRLFLDSMSRRLPLHWLMPLTAETALCGSCEEDWVRHACVWSWSWCTQRWKTS